jgi:predicted RNA-binding Zn-ribbon protein involved in translation (DUF1610 family)
VSVNSRQSDSLQPGYARRAAADRSLLIVLASVAALAAGVGLYRLVTAERRVAAVAPASGDATALYCPECREVSLVQPDVLAKIARDAKTGAYECPICKKQIAQIGVGPPGRRGP